MTEPGHGLLRKLLERRVVIVRRQSNLGRLCDVIPKRVQSLPPLFYIFTVVGSLLVDWKATTMYVPRFVTAQGNSLYLWITVWYQSMSILQRLTIA